MLKHAILALSLMSSAAMADIVYKGTGVFIASNGIAGNWEQKVTVTNIANGFHINKDQSFSAAGTQRLDYTFGYDLIGSQVNSWDIAMSGRSLGSASCLRDACFYKANESVAGFDLDASITAIGETYHKIGTLLANWNGEEVTVRYDGSYKLQQ